MKFFKKQVATGHPGGSSEGHDPLSCKFESKTGCFTEENVKNAKKTHYIQLDFIVIYINSNCISGEQLISKY